MARCAFQTSETEKTESYPAATLAGWMASPSHCRSAASPLSDGAVVRVVGPITSKERGMAERLRGRAGQRQRERRLARTDGLCERCAGLGRWQGRGLNRVSVATVVNHIIPLAHGGSDEDENTENLCRPCDLDVTAEQFGHTRSSGLGGCDVTGWPTDPAHPWRQAGG